MEYLIDFIYEHKLISGLIVAFFLWSAWFFGPRHGSFRVRKSTDEIIHSAKHQQTIQAIFKQIKQQSHKPTGQASSFKHRGDKTPTTTHNRKNNHSNRQKDDTASEELIAGAVIASSSQNNGSSSSSDSGCSGD